MQPCGVLFFCKVVQISHSGLQWPVVAFVVKFSYLRSSIFSTFLSFLQFVNLSFSFFFVCLFNVWCGSVFPLLCKFPSFFSLSLSPLLLFAEEDIWSKSVLVLMFHCPCFGEYNFIVILFVYRVVVDSPPPPPHPP